MLDIDVLERALTEKRYADAGLDFHALMDTLYENSALPNSQIVFSSRLGHMDDAALTAHLSKTVFQLFVDPQSQISVPGYDALMSWQVTLSRLFYLTDQAPYNSADAAIEQLLQQSKGWLSGELAIKLNLLFGTESSYALRLQTILLQNPELFLNTCMMHIWACSGTQQSCDNREWAYSQIPPLFELLDNPNIPIFKIHGYFMHCSYGFASNKHALKASLNRILQSKIAKAEVLPNPSTVQVHRLKALAHQQRSGKPVILVVLEMFNEVHAVYRVLGKSLRALKQSYTVVAVAWPGYVHIADDFFDELISLSAVTDNYCQQEMVDIAAAYQPVAVYYPSLGMTPWTIYHSNMRLAPVQFTAVGHGASSFATEIDYFVIESDIAGDSNTYSEQVIALKPGSMPFYPPSTIHYPQHESKQLQSPVLNMVCSASTMKLNYKLLEICQKIESKYQNTSQKIAFHFFVMSYGTGMSAQSYKKLIQSYLPTATIHLAKDFQSYVDELSHMHISVSPFPYSGMNTVIDYAMLGIPGVRMQGPQVHEMIEAGMWRRMGMPEWTIVNDALAYEAALYRLIDTPGLWQTLSAQLQKEQRWKVFFEGDASMFVDAVKSMIDNHPQRST